MALTIYRLIAECNYRNFLYTYYSLVFSTYYILLMTIVCKYLVHSAITIHVHVAVQVESPASVMGSADQLLCCVRLKVTMQKHCL